MTAWHSSTSSIAQTSCTHPRSGAQDAEPKIRAVLSRVKCMGTSDWGVIFPLRGMWLSPKPASHPDDNGENDRRGRGEDGVNDQGRTGRGT
eukprot:3130872-Pyramimonas_sp.AAC.1